jgi:hypothetical protein
LHVACFLGQELKLVGSGMGKKKVPHLRDFLFSSSVFEQQNSAVPYGWP